MTFWTSANAAIWISVFVLVPIFFNLFNVRRYGEWEFWITAFKTITCVGLIVLGILLQMDSSPGPLLLGTDNNHHTVIPCQNVQTDNCVSHPGFNCIIIFCMLTDYVDWREDAMKPFIVGGGSGRLAGFWLSCCRAAFAYIGVESIGITAYEVERPRESLPKAVRQISWRLTFYYISFSVSIFPRTIRCSHTMSVIPKVPIKGHSFSWSNVTTL